MSELQSIELDIDDIKFEESKSSSNFGAGAELLMNTSKMNKEKSSRDVDSDIDLGDLKNMADELDDYDKPSSKTKKSFLFDNDNNLDSITLKLDDNETKNLDINEPTPIKLVDDESKNQTWDGFKKMSSVPEMEENTNKTRKEDVLREKFILLRKLENLESKHNVRLSKQYSMESNLDEMRGEYEMIMSEKEKSNSIKFQGKMLKMAIWGLELLNNKVDPFDLKLDGWHEQIEENIDDYDEIFAELHEKYHSKAKMAPELKLLFSLAGSAITIHMTNSIFNTKLPSMDSYLQQHPELMKQFSQAAVNSVSDTNPGFSGFINNIMGNSSPAPAPAPAPTMMGPPPPAVQTKQSHPGRGGGGNNNAPNRPDLSFARSGNDEPIQKSKRSEMKGPSDISSILDGLKTKKSVVNNNPNTNTNTNTINASEMKNIQEKLPVPKSRRKRSEKNTISLDI